MPATFPSIGYAEPPPPPPINRTVLGANLRKLGALLGAADKVRFVQTTRIRGGQFMRMQQRPALATREDAEKIARFFGIKPGVLFTAVLTQQQVEMAEDWIKEGRQLDSKKATTNIARSIA